MVCFAVVEHTGESVTCIFSDDFQGFWATSHNFLNSREASKLDHGGTFSADCPCLSAIVMLNHPFAGVYIYSVICPVRSRAEVWHSRVRFESVHQCFSKDIHLICITDWLHESDSTEVVMWVFVRHRLVGLSRIYKMAFCWLEEVSVCRFGVRDDAVSRPPKR